MRHRDIVDRLTLWEKCRLLSGRDFWNTLAIAEKGVPGLCLSDGPHGVRRQAGKGDRLGVGGSLPATCFPTASAIANSWDPALAERVGRAMGEEAAAQGVDVLLGPGLNLKRLPLCGRNFEYYSEDPYLSGKLAAGCVRGIQSNGIAACVKHFAANNLELRRQASNSVVDARTLRELYLTGFEIAVREAAPKCVMSAYNQVNGVYANENKMLLTDILRGAWGFQGFVTSDWGGGNDFAAGVLAGCSLEMPSTGGDSPAQLRQAVAEGRVPEAVVDERVDALLDVALDVHRAARPAGFDADAHHALAREACARSAVLLKNSGLLPLPAGARVAVIGEVARNMRIQGGGSSQVHPTRVDALPDAVADSPLTLVGFAPGYSRRARRAAALTREAVALARRADAVLLALGLGDAEEQEGLDRRHMRLPEAQARLLHAVSEANPNVAVVLASGGPVETPWLDDCRALLYGGLCGQAGAGALVDLLTGTVNPSGKLSETWPMTDGDCPAVAWLPPDGINVVYREGLYVGYRYYEKAGVPVRFPFGYGLSYTRFDYGDLRVAADGVSFTVTNAGDRAGEEIAQLYISARRPRVYRPVKELKGFAKLRLAPGESRRVALPLDEYAFRYFNTVTNRFEVDGGEYEVLIGASVRDIRLSGALVVDGTDAPLPPGPEALPHYFGCAPEQADDGEFERLLGRPLPADAPPREMGMNDALCRMANARSLKARLLCRWMAWRLRRGEARGRMMSVLRSVYEMPPRALGKISGGVLSQRMCRALLVMINGHGLAFLRGLGMLIAGAAEQRRNRRKERRESVRCD